MRFLKTLALLCGLVAPAGAVNQYFATIPSTTTGNTLQYLAGQFDIAASSASISSVTANVQTKSTWTIMMNGATGNIQAVTFNGSAAGLTSVPAASILAGNLGASVIASSVAVGAVGSAQIAAGANITGNAATVTTNANLTGGVTSVGNAATVVTNANLTGNVTSVGNATTIAVIPAVSGAALTNLTPGNVSNGGLPDGVKVSTANISGGMNGASQLVQLNSSSQYPAKDGSLITNLSGTLSGGINTRHAVWTGSTALGNSSYVDEVSSGVSISTQVAIMIATMTVKTNGSITAPSQPGGRFYRNASQATSSVADTPVFFDTIDWNQGGLAFVASSSNVITIPIAGIYSVSCGVSWASNTTGERDLYINVNGTANNGNFLGYPNQGGATTAVVSDIINFTVGATVACGTFQNGTSGLTIGGGKNSAFMAIQKLW